MRRRPDHQDRCGPRRSHCRVSGWLPVRLKPQGQALGDSRGRLPADRRPLADCFDRTRQRRHLCPAPTTPPSGMRASGAEAYLAGGALLTGVLQRQVRLDSIPVAPAVLALDHVARADRAGDDAVSAALDEVRGGPRRSPAPESTAEEQEARDANTWIHHGNNHGGRRGGPRAAGGHVIAGHTAVLEDQENVTPRITGPRQARRRQRRPRQRRGPCAGWSRRRRPRCAR
jgi:hypothetical protein